MKTRTRPDTQIAFQDGELKRYFNISTIIKDRTIEWVAQEIGGVYTFYYACGLKDEIGGYATFINRIKTGFATKTLKEGKITNKGSVFIEENGIVIDDHFLPFSQIKELFQEEERIRMDFVKRDKYYPVLKKDEYLVPVTINLQSILNKYRRIALACMEDNFLTHEKEEDFAFFFKGILQDLKILMDHGQYDLAQKYGNEIIEQLRMLHTYSDSFANSLIEKVLKTTKR
ncbi:MAG: hypothetical protein Q4C49_05385 [Bacillota bacterium]|nr:hypothetical protein [Bacillota bacterium]